MAVAAASTTTEHAAAAARTKAPTILYMSLNQDHSCIAVGTTHGFNIFSVDPLKDRFHKGAWRR